MRTGDMRLEPLTSRHHEHVLAMLRDERTWRHIAGAAADAETKWRSMVASAAASRHATGLAPWAVYLGDCFVGSGGAQVLPHGMWNVGFRFVPEAWGQGLAGRVGRAAVEAASAARPEWPLTGRTAAENIASSRVLASLGMVLRWEGEGSSGPAQVWSDRPVEQAALQWLVEHT